MSLLVSVCSDEAGRDQIGDTENEGAVSGGILVAEGSSWFGPDGYLASWVARSSHRPRRCETPATHALRLLGVSHPPVSRRSVGNTSKQPYFHLSACRRSPRARIQSAIQGKWVFTSRIEGCAKPQAPGVSQAALLIPEEICAREPPSAEADLIHSIRHGTVGGTLPDLTGTRLDGTEEPLSTYHGKVVLLDFWATWCSPCVDALPELRELVAELPADRFALLAISLDEEPATVTRFMEDEPMPWMNWHAGPRHNIVRILDVRAFPTYVLVDEQGRILARHSGLTGPLKSLLRATVEG